ncbi:hypothetical protein Tco_0715250 [Tanacetum coccineum]
MYIWSVISDPSLLLDFEEINMANDPNNVQGPPPVGPNLHKPNPDLRPMEELLQAPTDGVGDAIVVPSILANQFELKIDLLNLVTAIAFHGFENDDPHSHIRRFTVKWKNNRRTLMDWYSITSPTSTAHIPPLGIQPVSPPKPKEDPKPKPYQPKIPYPSRLNKTKLLDKNDVQVSKFLKILKQLHFNIMSFNALTQIPKFTKVLKDLLKDKEKLEELANTLMNAECSAILLNKVLEKLGDPKKFLIPYVYKILRFTTP